VTTWFEERGIADVVLDIEFDGDRKGRFPKGFDPKGDWFAVPLKPGTPSEFAWDCRLILDGLVPATNTVYRLDGFFLSPETARAEFPVGSRFTIFPGRAVGHGTIVEWREV
jgi:hypothetical protein